MCFLVKKAVNEVSPGWLKQEGDTARRKTSLWSHLSPGLIPLHPKSEGNCHIEPESERYLYLESYKVKLEKHLNPLQFCVQDCLGPKNYLRFTLFMAKITYLPSHRFWIIVWQPIFILVHVGRLVAIINHNGPVRAVGIGEVPQGVIVQGLQNLKLLC